MLLSVRSLNDCICFAEVVVGDANAPDERTGVESFPNLKGVDVGVFIPNEVVKFALLENSPLPGTRGDAFVSVVIVLPIEPFGAENIGFSLDAVEAVNDVT